MTEKLNLWPRSQRCFTSLLLNEISDYAHYAVFLHWLHSLRCFTSLLLNEISDYAYYAVLLHYKLKWNIWIRSLCCFSSLTILSTLSYFTTIKWKSLTTLTTLFYFTTIKMKYLTSLTTLFFLTTIKMKSLTTLTALFYFTTTNPWDRTTLTTLLLSLIHQIVFPQEFQCFHKICMCHSNFTVRKFSGVVHFLLAEKISLFRWKSFCLATSFQGYSPFIYGQNLD